MEYYTTMREKKQSTTMQDNMGESHKHNVSE